MNSDDVLGARENIAHTYQALKSDYYSHTDFVVQNGTRAYLSNDFVRLISKLLTNIRR